MDSIINAAALALATGDVLGALNRVALRNDPPALALHGIAMAQLGDFEQARALLARAAQGFGTREDVARARCVVAEAEIALVSRDLGWPPERLVAAREVLIRRGDAHNGAHARCIEARRLLLLGQLADADESLAALDPDQLPPPLLATYWLTSAGIAIRRLQVAKAHQALSRASAAAGRSGIPALIGEVSRASEMLDAPAAMLTVGEMERPVTLGEMEMLFASSQLVVDGTRNVLRRGETLVALGSRPVLFALLRALGTAAPGSVTREVLLAKAFQARHADESHRARLRVEMTRLRRVIADLAEIVATPDGYRLRDRADGAVAVLAYPDDARDAAVLALLGDGAPWASSALALVLGSSTRTVQRALDDLRRRGKVQAVGRGRAQRWTLVSLPGFPTALLLQPG